MLYEHKSCLLFASHSQSVHNSLQAHTCDTKCVSSHQTGVTDQHMLHIWSYFPYVHYIMGCSQGEYTLLFDFTYIRNGCETAVYSVPKPMNEEGVQFPWNSISMILQNIQVNELIHHQSLKILSQTHHHFYNIWSWLMIGAWIIYDSSHALM
jgi:hypothetical protein